MSKFNRRFLLEGVGAAALALPFLKYAKSAEAQSSAKKFVFFFTPDEPINRAHWAPSGNTLQFHPVMQALEPFKSKIYMVGDLGVPSFSSGGSGHYASGSMSTGVPNNGGDHTFKAGGISIDQFIANRLNTESLVLASGTGIRQNPYGIYRITWRGPSDPVNPIVYPDQALDAALGNAPTEPPPTSGPPKEWVKRNFILDKVTEQIRDVKGRLPASDRIRLDQHLTSLEELHRDVTVEPPPIGTCNRPSVGSLNPDSNADVPKIAEINARIVAQSFACGTRRVAVLQHGSSGSYGTPTWPDYGININMERHEGIVHASYSNNHAGAYGDRRRQLEAFHYRQFAFFLKELEDANVLDDTVVLWAKPMSNNHGTSPMMYMFAGDRGLGSNLGTFKSYSGRAHNDVLLTAIKLMGLNDVNSFGSAQYNQGPLL